MSGGAHFSSRSLGARKSKTASEGIIFILGPVERPLKKHVELRSVRRPLGPNLRLRADQVREYIPGIIPAVEKGLAFQLRPYEVENMRVTVMLHNEAPNFLIRQPI